MSFEQNVFTNNMHISFDNIGGRFGNQLFRYVTCKMFTVKSGHKYIPREDFPEDNYVIVNDANITDILNNIQIYATKHILCQGFFTKLGFAQILMIAIVNTVFVAFCFST